MKSKDPEFMTRQLVINFSHGISRDSRIGLILFASKVDEILPLTPVEDPDLNKKMTDGLNRLTFGGKYTNIPLAIEKALYTLKQNGRKDAQKLIVFITDGFIDTGNARKNEEQGKWLKKELTQDSANNKIRIYSVAFSEEADFELIQTLALKTDGGYYRALTKSDLQGVFETILATVNIQDKGPTPPDPTLTTPQKQGENTAMENSTTSKEGISKNTLIITGAILFFLGCLLIARKTQKKRPVVEESRQESSHHVEQRQSSLPEAVLEDINHVTGHNEILLTKNETTIGRAVDLGMQSVDIGIPQDTISALHAVITYRDSDFFIIDRRSTNKTFLNQQILPADTAQVLKSGDIINFDRYPFRFVIKQQENLDGKVFRPVAAGGTILRPQRFPDQIVRQPDPEIQPDETHLINTDNEGTQIKTQSLEKPSSQPGALDWKPVEKSLPEDDEERTIMKLQTTEITPSQQHKHEMKSEAASSTNDSEEHTRLKQKMCENHPSFKVVEYCAVCGKGYCKQCIVEKDGAAICRLCAGE